MPRILLIEDEDSIRHLISYDLKNEMCIRDRSDYIIQHKISSCSMK